MDDGVVNSVGWIRLGLWLGLRLEVITQVHHRALLEVCVLRTLHQVIGVEKVDLPANPLAFQHF